MEIERKFKSFFIDLFFEQNNYQSCKFDNSIFDNHQANYNKTLENIKKTSYFLINKKNNFDSNAYQIPEKHSSNFWRIIQEISLGDLSKMINILDIKYKNLFIEKLNIVNKHYKLHNLLKNINDIRNIIAHDEYLYMQKFYYGKGLGNGNILQAVKIISELLSIDSRKHLTIGLGSLFSEKKNILLKFDKNLYEDFKTFLKLP